MNLITNSILNINMTHKRSLNRNSLSTVNNLNVALIPLQYFNGKIQILGLPAGFLEDLKRVVLA